jgi:hypothetical protein
MKRMIPLVAAVFAVANLVAGTVEDSARKIAGASANAVVHVSAINKITISGPLAAMMGGGQEQKVEAVATIIDPSGLAVVAESAINPTALMKGGMEVNVGGQTQKLDMKAELTEVKYRLADGTEFAGRIVLTDSDLDLAFIVPEEAISAENKAKIATVTVEADAPKPALLDQLVVLGRAKKALQYTSTVNIVRVNALLEKPRPFYVAGVQPSKPVFSADGTFIGLSAVRRSGGAPKASMGRAQVGGAPVIVPAADVAELAIQAKAEVEN